MTSCDDTLTSENAVDSNIQSNQKAATALSQTDLKDKLKATALVLKQVTQRPKVLEELRFAIDFYSDKDYTDERVYLSDMLESNSAYKKELRSENKSDIIGSFAQMLQDKNRLGNIFKKISAIISKLH